MNLVTDPWLLVTDSKNQLTTINLNQLFEEPDEWGDLVLKPHERVSIMRFLICIVQAALDGPEDEDEWDDALNEIPGSALNYLDKWKEWFFLYDEKKPFLQIADLEPFNKEPTPVTKLNFCLATGKNHTLFDHSGINVNKDEMRLLSESNLIISMLTFNNFSLSGLSPQAKWKKIVTLKSGVRDAPCSSRSMLHCFIKKKTIIETIHANILTHEQIKDRYGNEIGIPIWELFPSAPDDERAIKNATQTYIGRLVPLSRWLKILPDKKSMLMGEGFVYPVHPDFKEATAVEVILKNKNKEELKLLSGKNISPWRKLQAITTKRRTDQNNIGGPAALENQSMSDSYDIHILAMKREQASVLDLAESILHVPNYFSTSKECKAAYSMGVKKAELKSFSLDKSIQSYLSFLFPNMMETVKKGINSVKMKKEESEKYRKIKDRVREKYLIHYWTLVEKQLHVLMQYVSLIGTDKDEARKKAEKDWLTAIHYAAVETYQTLCSRESPRQMRAYIAGLNILQPKRVAKQEEK